MSRDTNRNYKQQSADVMSCLPGDIAQIIERSGWCKRVVAETLKQLADDGVIRKVWEKGWKYKRQVGRPKKQDCEHEIR